MRGKTINFKGLSLIFLALTLIFGLVSSTFAIEGSLTITDREIIERLTRLEEGQEGLNKRIDDLRSELKGDINSLKSELKGDINSLRSDLKGDINNLGGRIDDLRVLVLGGFGVILAGIFALIGFVIWDRRSAISPVINRTRDIEEEEKKILKALKQYSQKEPKFAEVMKSVGLL